MWEPTKKNFSPLAPLGAEKIDPEVSNFEIVVLGIFSEKMPQDPQKGQKSILMVFLGIGDPNGLQKNFGNLWDEGAKSVYMLTECAIN